MSHQPRQLLAYGTVFVFIIFIFFSGVKNSRNSYASINLKDVDEEQSNATYEGTDLSWSNFPDLSYYDSVDALTPDQFPMNEPGRRVILVGDIHGMIKPFKTLLKRLRYDASNDVLIHVGDIIAKGTQKGSLEVLDFMTSNNITGVRGNHDQLVIEWRGWLDWISTLPGGKLWLDSLEGRWRAVQDNEQGTEMDAWIQDEANAARRQDKQFFKSIPKGWKLFGDHHKIAKDMTSKHFNYLLRLPLRLYVPSAHFFVVHAGLLPSNPQYAIDDKENQPLARLPRLPRRKGTHEDLVSSATSGSNKRQKVIDQLRHLQEISLLTEIPQNVDPWNIINIRSVVHGKVSKSAKKGTPWAKIWNQHMDSCVGYGKKLRSQLGDDDEDDDIIDDLTITKTKNKLSLPCHPITTIYGHAASRGLDVKRWSLGLDSGCVYGHKLSALVLDGPGLDRPNVNNDDDDVDNELELLSSIPFGDNARAKIVSLKC